MPLDQRATRPAGYLDAVESSCLRRITNCFVAADRATGEIAGFYTLSVGSTAYLELPQQITKRLPRYPMLPAIQVGRLAVDSRYGGRGVGSALLPDATLRSARAEPAAFALLVDAKDDTAAGFYRKHGFVALTNRPLTLFLPIATALKLFS